MYYLGLDLGTSSLGWSLTDESYHLIRKKGRDLWGVRLFEKAETAEKRRINRTSRRRRAREKARIGMVRSYFSEAISAVDPEFYLRLEESKYHPEDKKVDEKYGIFCDPGFTDKEYFQEYPTIFHLRQKLMQGGKEYDIRLVYLAVLNIFKHRGHFLNEDVEMGGQDSSLSELYDELRERAEGVLGISLPGSADEKAMDELLSSRSYSRSEKTEQLAALLGISKKEKTCYEIIKLMCGLSGRLSNIWPKDILGEENEKKQLSFLGSGYEESIEALSAILTDEDMELLDCIKRIHDKGLLGNILRGHTCLSDARVESYQKHKEDLQKLRIVIRQYCGQEVYHDYFRTLSEDSYGGYVGYVFSGQKRSRRKVKAARDNYDKFWKHTKALLSAMPETDETVMYLRKELERDNLLPKQLTSSNGVIPYQLHFMELQKILEQAQEYHPFLKEKDESNLSVTERILQLFAFRIPYYVGPLYKKEEDQNKWVVRKEQTGKVLPWNLEEKIDLEETRQAFILQLVRHCSYLNDEKVLPKSSLLYEKFMVLNQLNMVRVYGEKLEPELKQKLYWELFASGKKVGVKKLAEALMIHGKLTDMDLGAISGVDTDFPNTLTSYKRFYDVLGDRIHEWKIEKMAEDIIFYATVFLGEKKMLREWMERKYGPGSGKEYLDQEQIRRLAGYKWKDWGNLSREFLELPGNVQGYPEEMSLIQAMWVTDLTLMELLSQNCTYLEQLKQRVKKQEKLLSEFTYEDLQDSYLSAPVKRMVWQTILLLKECAGIMGEEPKRLFIEMPRSENEKKRTESRKKKLEELYRGCQEDGKQWLKELSHLSEDDLRSRKLYLYYRQKGLCMYTGHPIALEELLSSNSRYDIDHIYPRHYVKDDSLENNLVLVEKESNQYKKDTYPVDHDVQKICGGQWRMLRDLGLISKEKYYRLTRKNGFTEEEMAGFISRQIVETGQATKFIAHLLEELLPDTEIIYVKAQNVSSFRKKNELLKARSLNDFHHAHDAYLNIVVGNTYHTKFTKNPLQFIKGFRGEKVKYHMDKIFEFDVSRNGEIAWQKGENGSIKTVRAMMGRNTPLLTKRTFEKHGGLADQTIYPADSMNPAYYIPIKTKDERMNNIRKYGGFKSVSGSYYFLVEHGKSSKRIRSMEQMPIYLKHQLEGNPEAMEQYCRERLGYLDPSVRMMKIPMRSLVKRDGYLMHLGGRTGNNICGYNAFSLFLERKWHNYVNAMENFKIKKKEEDRREDAENRITKEKNAELYRELLHKHNETLFQKMPNPSGKKLQEKEGVFLELNLKDQVSVLLDILKLTQCQNWNVQIKEIDFKSSPIKFSKNISKQNEFLLIHQSITGFYESVIDLKTV